jgi:sugar lactone lactonase YvrE
VVQISIASRRVALRAGAAAVATAAVLAGSSVNTVAVAVADQPMRGVAAATAAATSGIVKSGEKLEGGEEVKSANGKFTLRMQTDGNLVFVDDAKKVLFHTGTAPNEGAVATMQTDGNFTVTKGGKALFSTGTRGAGVNMHVQNDGNLTARTPDGKVLWALSDVNAGKAELRTGEKLKGGEERKSFNGRNTLRMQTDGNLVYINDKGKVLFHTGTAPNEGAVATMQTDGNLTVTKNGKALFSTGTQGKNVTLHVQDDENLTLRTPDGKVLWALNDVNQSKAELRTGQTLKGGEERKSFNGKNTLRMQKDGNLVLTNAAGKVLFHTGTAPNAGAVATMQADGNLTVTKNGKVLFATDTRGKNVTLHVQDDENLTLRTPDGKVLWARR